MAEFVECLECDGTGELTIECDMGYDHTIDCEECSGSGEVENEDEEEDED